MTSPSTQILAHSVQTHFESLGLECATIEDLNWVLKRWPLSKDQKRYIDISDIQPIEKLITTI
ncbi:MAG: hypothetical protein ACRCT7_04035, partial [Shewanella sp.]